MILAATLWQSGWLLADVVHYYGAETIWLQLQVKLPVYVLCLIGSVALLRGAAYAYKTIYAAALLILTAAAINWIPDGWIRWLAEQSPSGFARYAFMTQRIPAPFPGVVAFWVSYLAIIGVFTGTRLATRGARSRARPWHQFQLRSAFLFTSFLGLVVTSPLSSIRLYTSADFALAKANNADWLEHNEERALKLYGEVIRRYPYTHAWGKAIASSGQIYFEREDDRRTIQYLERLLAPRAPVELNMLDPLANVASTACESLSVCYERLGDYPKALEYAILAPDRYPKILQCGLGREFLESQKNQRIEHLRELAENSATKTEGSRHADKVETQLSAR